jgi:hypothetical protein
MFQLTRLKQRAESSIDLTLQQCNIRLSNYVSDIGCKSMQKVVKAEADRLLQLVHRRIRNKHTDEVIISSLSRTVSLTDRDMLRFSQE